MIRCPITRYHIQQVFEQALFDLYGTRKSVLLRLYWERWDRKSKIKKRANPDSYRNQPRRNTLHAVATRSMLMCWPDGKAEYPVQQGKFKGRIDFFVKNVVIEIKSAILTDTCKRRALYQAERYADIVGAREFLVFCEEARCKPDPRLVTSLADLAHFIDNLV